MFDPYEEYAMMNRTPEPWEWKIALGAFVAGLIIVGVYLIVTGEVVIPTAF